MPLKSPLHQVHVEFGAKFTEFAGFEMPIQYTSIKEEHLTVRKAVGLFDVSHMSNVWITGKDAAKLLSLTTVEDATTIPDGKSQYTVMLKENGTVIDDTIFMHLGKKFMLIPNAGMASTVTTWLNEQAVAHKLKATAEDVSQEYVILAIQGPKSQETLQQLIDTDLQKLGFFQCTTAHVQGVECIVSHTGYTGELGFELQIADLNQAPMIFQALLKADSQYGIKPIGLGARDTLRLEKCFILAGNEFEGGRTPLEALLSWTIKWDHDFIGKEALLKLKEKGSYEKLTYLECTGKGIPRHGCTVQKDGKNIGMVTSGTLSPCLNTGIAMAYMQPAFRDENSTVDILIRNTLVPAKIIKPPFVKKDWASHIVENV
jgi:aminomethyltransferase